VAEGMAARDAELKQSTAAIEAIIVQVRSPRLCGGESCFAPLRDRLSFLLSDCGQDVDNEPIGLGHIDGQELDIGLHQVRDEGNVSGETVQLSDHQGSAMLAAELQGGGECGPVVALTAFNTDTLTFRARR
jgi:hypothetical protein